MGEPTRIEGKSWLWAGFYTPGAGTPSKPFRFLMVRKAGLEPASLAALAPKASVFAISPLPHVGG